MDFALRIVFEERIEVINCCIVVLIDEVSQYFISSSFCYYGVCRACPCQPGYFLYLLQT